MSRQVSRGSAGEYQADEQAGVRRFRWVLIVSNVECLFTFLLAKFLGEMSI